MNTILNKMYENVEKLKDYEENKKILEQAIQEYQNKQTNLQNELTTVTGENRKAEIEKEVFKTEATIQHLRNRVHNQKEADDLEVSLLKGKYQIETKYEQLLGDYNAQMQQLEAQMQEEKAKEEEAIQNVQNKMKQYMDLDRDNVPAEVRANALQEMDNLDANRENIKAYYEGQYAGFDAKIEEVKAEKKKVMQFGEPLLEQAKHIVDSIQQKENRFAILQALSEEGKAFQAKQKAKEEAYEATKTEQEIEEQETMAAENMPEAIELEQASPEEESNYYDALTAFGATKVMTDNIIPKEKGDEETMKEMHEEATELPNQKIENVMIDVKTGKVYIALEAKKDEKEKKYQMVETIDFEQETDLESMDLMEESKMAVLRKHISTFGEACAKMENAKKDGMQDKEAIVTYHKYMDMFQDVDPIVVNTLEKIGRGKEIQQYVEAVVAGEKEKMPFVLDYDLTKMKESTFNLAQKENILYYARANEKVADEVRGVTGANIHIALQKFEHTHAWFGKIMTFMRGEETKTLPEPAKHSSSKENFKEGIKAKVDEQQALENVKENEQQCENIKETEQEK